MIFLKTGDETNTEKLEIEYFQRASKEREPVHIHPFQKSSFEVKSGEVHVWMDVEESVLKPGKEVIIPAGVLHNFWKEGDEEAHFYRSFWPALNIAKFFETYFDLARDGKLNKNGIKNIFHTAPISSYFKIGNRLINPPWAVQLVLNYILSPIGKLENTNQKNDPIFG